MTFFLPLALAISLLTTSAPVRPELFSYARLEVVRIALAAELMDEREVNYVCVRQNEFATDIAMLRQRATSLQYAPRIADQNRFTVSREVAGELIMLNRGYSAHLDRMIELYPERFWLCDARSENDQLYRAWDALRDAKCEFYYTHVRRATLAKLKASIGDEMFDRGEMPPPVPFWRFAEVRVP